MTKAYREFRTFHQDLSNAGLASIKRFDGQTFAGFTVEVQRVTNDVGVEQWLVKILNSGSSVFFEQRFYSPAVAITNIGKQLSNCRALDRWT